MSEEGGRTTQIVDGAYVTSTSLALLPFCSPPLLRVNMPTCSFHGKTNGTAWAFGCQQAYADPCSCNYTVQGLPAGVTCTRGHITALEFAFNGLQGQLSASLGLLGQLSELQLCGNPDLGGTFPPSVAKLVNLVNVDVSGCSMSGAIPDM